MFDVFEFLLYDKHYKMDNVVANVSKTNYLMHISRTPRMRERQRFDLTIGSEEDEEIDISGLNSMT